MKPRHVLPTLFITLGLAACAPPASIATPTASPTSLPSSTPSPTVTATITPTPSPTPIPLEAINADKAARLTELGYLDGCGGPLWSPDQRVVVISCSGPYLSFFYTSDILSSGGSSKTLVPYFKIGGDESPYYALNQDEFVSSSGVFDWSGKRIDNVPSAARKFSASKDGMRFAYESGLDISVYDFSIKDSIATFKLDPSVDIENLTLSPDGKTVIYSDQFGFDINNPSKIFGEKTHILDVGSQKEIGAFPRASFAFSPDGAFLYLVVGLYTNASPSIVVWDTQAGKILKQLPRNGCTPSPIVSSPGSARLFYSVNCSDSATFHVIDTTTNQDSVVRRAVNMVRADSNIISRDESVMAGLYIDTKGGHGIGVFSLATGELLIRLSDSDGIPTIFSSPDGKIWAIEKDGYSNPVFYGIPVQ